MKSFQRTYLPLLVILLISFVPLFINLGTYPIQIWDESRMATSAYEMSLSNQLLIPTFQGGSELWNTKPPLLIWCQYVCIKIFGVSEFAIRLPSALAGLGIFISLFLGLKRLGYHFATSLLAILLLITSIGFTGWHCLRTGDYDALMTLFLVIQIGSFYLYLITVNRKESLRFLHISLIAIVLGVLTKGVNALFFTPMMAVWWLASKKWKDEEWLSFGLKIVLTFVGCLAYYLIRELVEPGYIYWVRMNELGGRFSEAIENHHAEPTFYLTLFVKQTWWWIYAVLPITVLGFVFGKKDNRKLLLYLLSMTTMFFAVIQISETKNIWYNVPLFPLLASLFAISLEILVRKILQFITPRKMALTVNLFLLVGLLSGKQYIEKYIQTTHQTEHVTHHDNYYEVTNYIRSQLHEEHPQSFKFIDLEYSAHNWWYINRLQAKGGNQTFHIDLDSLASGDILLLNQPHVYDSILTMFHVQELDSNPHYHLILID